MDPWTLIATEPSPHLLYLANGYLGTALNWDGGVLYESEGCPCYARGVYDAGAGGIDQLALLPCWSRLRYGTPTTVSDYERRLDMRRGLVTTNFVLKEERGTVHLQQRIFVSRADPYLAAVQIRIRPEFKGPISLLAGLSTPGGSSFEVLEAGAGSGTLSLVGRIPTYNIHIAEALSFQGEQWAMTPDATKTSEACCTLTASGGSGCEMILTQMVSLVSSLDVDLSVKPAHPVVPAYAQALDEHEQAWTRQWATDIEIGGDVEAQQFTRAALFYLWSSVREDDRWSIAPMGLSSNGYNGHIFWDAELWMYPPLLLTQPDMARACLAYREDTLEPAIERASKNGYRGAQFPWEGGFTGQEMTPHWADTRDFQLHITADVAIGQWWYFINTQDTAWLREHGFRVIQECAEFWVSRVEYVAEHDRYEISDVVCADEYAAHVDNDAFTNAAVRSSLLIAERAARRLGEPVAPEWREIADRLYIPYDNERGIHLEFDGYDGQVTKQADVELLAFPLEHAINLDQVARDLDFYGTVIDPDGPAMSFSVYAILSAQLGRANQAYTYFRRSFIPNTRPPFWSFSETPTNNDLFFCTGIGGALQTLLFGFTGLRLREGYFSLRPILPDRWPALRLRNLFISGTRTDLEIERDCYVIRRHSEVGMVAIMVRPHGSDLSLTLVEGPPVIEITITDLGDTVRTASTIPLHGELTVSAPPAGIRVRLCVPEASVLDVLLHPAHTESLL